MAKQETQQTTPAGAATQGQEQQVQQAVATAVTEGADTLASIEDPEVLRQAVERLTADNTKLLAENTQLKEVNTQYVKAGEGQELQLKEALALIEEQQKALATEPVSDIPVITIDKKKYRVAVPVISVKGREIKAADLKDNMEVAKALLAKNSSVLVPIN